MRDGANTTDKNTGKMRERKEVKGHVMKEKLEAGMTDSENKREKERTGEVARMMTEMLNLEMI
jgi:hypothetical protein